MPEMKRFGQNVDYILKEIKSDMNKMLNERCVGGNQFHTNSILSAIEELNNKILSVMKNVTTSYGDEDVLPKDKELKELCMIDEVEEVGYPGN